MASLPLYTIELIDPTTRNVTADISTICTTRNFSITRNRAEQVDLEMNLLVAERLARDLGVGFWGLFAAGVTEIRITRANRPLLISRLADAYPSMGASNSIQLKAMGILDSFGDRYLWPGDTLSYSATDVGQLAWNRITQTQNRSGGNLGITLGAIQPSRAIDEDQQYWARSIKDILVDYTNLSDSGDFEFTPDKQFNWYAPSMGRDLTDVIFEYPGNIAQIGGRRDASQLVNQSVNRGKGNGNAQRQVSVSDANSYAVFGRHERISDYPSIDSEDLLTGYGNETLRTNSYPLVIPDITLQSRTNPPLGEYWIGDRVKLAIPGRSSFGHLDGQMVRINEIDVSVDNNDHETISVKVSIL